jgi:hypothetical protein
LGKNASVGARREWLLQASVRSRYLIGRRRRIGVDHTKENVMAKLTRMFARLRGEGRIVCTAYANNYTW